MRRLDRDLILRIEWSTGEMLSRPTWSGYRRHQELRIPNLDQPYLLSRLAQVSLQPYLVLICSFVLHLNKAHLLI